ncbi:MAG: dihydropteroate synthase [Proteobacteria bacterium]|nr:dihydropteroate synthase [Pseudomonadota bacterium]
MGILNVTPDSFSDGGNFASHAAAIAQADQLISDGADILDIGGESTRPFAVPVTPEEELRRVIPVIQAIRKKHQIPISIDTTKAAVADQALKAGADIINDISALRNDPEMLALVQKTSVPVLIMHMQGTPADMQMNPVYTNVTKEIIDFFSERITWLTANGVDRNRLIIDPGIGFGKTLYHNLSIIKHLDELGSLGLPVLLGHSRKRFLGEITEVPLEAARDLATAVVSALCADKNISILRVHNVAATHQALLVAAAISGAA